MLRWTAAGVVALVTACNAPVRNRPQVDPRIAREIASLKAIDNHAHPMRAVNEGEKDSEYDALPVGMMESYDTMPLRLRTDNPEFGDASRALFGRPDAKPQTMKDKGEAYPAWVLDRLGIGVMFSNRVAMGRGLPADRFKWVPYADALMYPLSNQNLGKRDPDRKAFFGGEEKLLLRYLSEAGLTAMPATLREYLAFVSSVLSKWKQGGAVAVKLEMAYLRTLEVGDPDRADEERLYGTYFKSGVPADAGYKDLQDFLFRHIAAECGRLGMPLHFHSSAGAGRYFDLAGVRPTLLIPVLVDPALLKTRFVFVHGSWPYGRELTALLDKPNVYLDFSGQGFMVYPHALAEEIRSWLEYAPEKVMFGTDASPVTDQIGWEETGWMSAATGRDALGIALTAMVQDREITRDRAMVLARMVMRDNAAKLYGFKQ